MFYYMFYMFVMFYIGMFYHTIEDTEVVVILCDPIPTRAWNNVVSITG